MQSKTTTFVSGTTETETVEVLRTVLLLSIERHESDF